MSKAAAVVCGAVAVGGTAALPYLLSSVVSKQLPPGSGKFVVGSLVQRDATGLLVRLFYPLDGAAPAQVELAQWLPAPSQFYTKAIGHFLKLPAGLAGWVLGPGLGSIRGNWVEERQHPGALPTGLPEKVPVVCFSHGLGGFQTAYSLIACELASRGMVVIMPEHADSSAAGTTFPDARSEIFCERSSEARMNDPTTGQPDGGFAWRNSQVHQRVREVFTALASTLRDSKTAGHSWAGRLDASNISMAGHSFGGATAVAACAAAPPGSGGTADCPFDGFKCGVVLDGWLFPVVGDGVRLETAAIDRDFGHPDYAAASEVTPLLFLDAASFLADRRWWIAKHELVQRGKAGHAGSVLLNLHHSVHHSFSDVNVVGEKAVGLIGRLRAKPDDTIKRGGVADEVSGAKVDTVDSNRAPGPVELHAESTRLVVDFIATHTSHVEPDPDGLLALGSDWVERFKSRQQGWIGCGGSGQQVWKVLAAAESLGLHLEPDFARM